MKYLSIRETSEKWGLSVRRIQTLCTTDRIEGATRIGYAGEVDWNEQAVKAGQSYLDMKGFSRDGLIQQLSSEYGDKFTVEQATYAADQLGL